MEIITSAGSSPLFAAAQKGYISIVKILVEKGNASKFIIFPYTFRYYIFLNSNILDIHGDYFKGRIPLHQSAQENHLEVCQYLIDKGSNVNKIASNGMTPIYLAAAQV